MIDLFLRLVRGSCRSETAPETSDQKPSFGAPKTRLEAMAAAMVSEWGRAWDDMPETERWFYRELAEPHLARLDALDELRGDAFERSVAELVAAITVVLESQKTPEDSRLMCRCGQLWPVSIGEHSKCPDCGERPVGVRPSEAVWNAIYDMGYCAGYGDGFSDAGDNSLACHAVSECGQPITQDACCECERVADATDDGGHYVGLDSGPVDAFPSPSRYDIKHLSDAWINAVSLELSLRSQLKDALESGGVA